MEFALISPTKITRRKDGPFQGAFEIALQYQFSIIEHGIEIKKPINTFHKSSPKGTHRAVVKLNIQLPNEVAETYLKFQSLIGHCITNGEDINNQLRDLLLPIVELNRPKEDILKMDFMALRDLLSEFLDDFK